MTAIPHLTPSDRAACTLYAPRRFNKRSRQRFSADRTAELIRHLGREPSYVERILISRIIAVEFDLRRIDAKLDAGDELSGHDMRARLAAENRLRLDLQALGMKPTAPTAPSLQDYLAAKAASAAEAA
jgi:hypothetical protein